MQPTAASHLPTFMEVQTSILVVAIIFLAGAFFSWIGGILETAKLQPQIDEERRQKLQLELRHQRDEETAAEAQHKIKDLTARCTQLEQQLAQAQAHVDQAEGEALTARQGARELELQILPTQTRVGDLEGALSAERGRLGALQTALEAKQDLVQQLTNELTTTNNTLANERSSTQQRENALRDQLAEHEKFLASGSTQAEAIKAELDKARVAHAAFEQETEARAGDWNRKLAAAENKYQMLQKEYMSLVNSGGHGDAAAAIVAAEELARAQERARAAEARLQELEEQLAHSDAGTRKKLRETEYRICELEAKLADADEAKALAVAEAVASLTPPAPTSEVPRPEYLAKLHEELAATKEKCLQLARERDEARSITQGLAPTETGAL